MRLSILGERNPNWRGGGKRSCFVCGAPVWVVASRIDRLRHHCSKACANATLRNIRGAATTRWSGGPEQRACVTCGEFFLAHRREINRGNGRYCSNGCAITALRKIRSSEEIARDRLNQNMTSQICLSLRGAKRRRHWQELVGYTAVDLAVHLERQFLPGMTWSNRSEWHIDHIRPRSSFKFTSADDPSFRECWALSNLRPLWAKENLKKGARLTEAAA